MNAGDLNRRVNIEARSAGVDSIGQPVETWTTVAALWADVKHLSGYSAIKSGADVSVVKASVRIRYSAGITAGMRVICGATTYQIDAVMHDSRKAFTDLVCKVVA